MNYECKKTLSLIDFQKIRVISSPASVNQCFEYKKKQLMKITHSMSQSSLVIIIHAVVLFMVHFDIKPTHMNNQNMICNMFLFLGFVKIERLYVIIIKT